MLEKIVEIKNICDYVIKITNTHNRNIEKLNKAKETIEQLNVEIKHLKKENKVLQRDNTILCERIEKQKEKLQKKMEKTSVRKQKRLTKTYTNKDTSTPYNWDKDCAFYEKCRAKNNRLCHYCKENNTYIAK